MAIKTETVQIKGPAGSFSAYFGAPQGGGAVPGVLVIQEIFGVNKHMREMVERFANAGYAAVSPDIFWSVQPGIELGYTPDDIAKGREMRGKLDTDKVVQDLGATLAVLRARPECKGKKVGVTGYCFGGLLTFLTAARFKPDASSAYYGGGIAGVLGEAGKVSAPIQFHFGEKDPSIPMADVQKVRDAVKGLKNAEVFTYPDADHGFNCNHRGSYNEAASKKAWERTQAHFGKYLA
jgi:carboxymethylenebutenolidase